MVINIGIYVCTHVCMYVQKHIPTPKCRVKQDPLELIGPPPIINLTNLHMLYKINVCTSALYYVRVELILINIFK